MAKLILYLKLFFSIIKGGFPQQGPRATCDCISGPRLIPAVSWGHPAYIMRALRSAHIRKMRNHTTMNPGALSHTAPHAHDGRSLDLTLRVLRFPAPRTPHIQTTLVSRIGQKPEQSRRTIGAQWCTGYTHAVRNTRNRC